jgi:hypothetical protein
MRVAVAALLLIAACASTPKVPLTAPQWDAVPAPVLDALCARLQMDAIASGSPVAIVGTTRALATPQTMSALALVSRGSHTSRSRVAASAADANRFLPITTEGTSCIWRVIPANQIDRHRDEMLVELSAPMLHPFAAKQAGLFARASVGGQGASWYWISLVPTGDTWSVSGVGVLVQ